MTTLLTCPRGHQWEPFDAGTSTAELNVCPECGAVALADGAVSAALPDTQHTGVDKVEQVDSNEGTFVTDESAAVTARPLPTVPGYEVLEVLGHGGMGVVYKARQVQLKRIVALKMILAGQHASAKELQRFRTEAEASARLRHPNIVQVYEIGEHQGVSYFSLEYVPGGSLESKLAGRPYDIQRSAELTRALALAMHAAHAHGIIHRDLKPANILLDADGTPKIADFGLAKQLDTPAGQTRTGLVMGTPSYMAPEQAAGRVKEIGPLSDQYSLGAILYEMLTGKPPFAAESPFDTIMQVVQQEPKPLTQIRSDLPRDLATICHKCLAKEQGKRYASAQALADDLQRFLTGRPVLARPIGPLERLGKWGRRQPALATLFVLVLLLAAAGAVAFLSDNPIVALIALIGPITVIAFGGVTWQWRRAEGQRRQAEAARREAEEHRFQAEAARKHAEQQRSLAEAARKHAEQKAAQAASALLQADGNLYVHLIHMASREWASSNVANAEKMLKSCPQALRRWEWRYLRRLCQSSEMVLSGHARPVLHAVFSPDGRWLASGGWDQQVKLWNASTGEPGRAFSGHGAQVTCVAFSPDGTRLASAAGDHTVKLWEVATGQPLGTLRAQRDTVNSVCFSPDGELLAVGVADGTVRVCSARDGREVFSSRRHGREVNTVEFRPDGRLLASASGDGSIKLWRVDSGQEIASLHEHRGAVLDLAFDPTGRYFASSGDDHSVLIWDATGQLLHTCKGHAGPVLGVAFDSQGKYVASASADQTLKVWDAASGTERFTLRGHRGPVSSVAFSPDGKRLASTGADQTIRFWDTAGGSESRTFQAHTGPVWAVAVRSDGQWLASAGGAAKPNEPGEVHLHRLSTGELVRSLREPAAEFRSIAFHPDGRRLAAGVGGSGPSQGHLLVWDAAGGQELFRLKGHTRPVVCLAYSPDGRKLASASADGTIILWDAQSGEMGLHFREHSGLVQWLTFSPDGRTIASASADVIQRQADVKLWEAASGKVVLTLPRPAGCINGLSFRADGKYLASAGSDRAVKLWRVADGKEIATFLGHGDEVAAVAFSPDGFRLFSASRDQTIRVWDAVAAQELLTLRGHTGPVTALSFSRDGRCLASASEDRTVRLWEAPPPAAASATAASS